MSSAAHFGARRSASRGGGYSAAWPPTPCHGATRRRSGGEWKCRCRESRLSEPELRDGTAQHHCIPTSNTMGLQIAPPQTVPKVGGTFQVAVKLSGGQDVFSVPMQLHYDNSKLA